MIKSSLKTLGIATTLTSVIVGYTGIAQAASITTSGTWTNVNPTNTVSLNGVGSNQINWGSPANSANRQSGYVFDGVTSQPLTLPSGGNSTGNFALGTFTHNNFPILVGSSNSSISGATLALNLNITNGSVFNQTFTFNFNHNETPNNGINGFCPSTPGIAAPCPDVVSFLNNGQSNETITINGEEYALFISGFQQNGALVDQFITYENQANSAQIFGSLVKTQQAVPEPLTMLGVGTAMGFGTLFKRKMAKTAKKR